jgi:DNA-binding CsgD family transcriptional regulator
VVVLAGGDGQRLRALTTNPCGHSTPKQYCSLDGGQSLLQMALQRALAVTSRKRIVTVVTEAHRSWWEREFLALPHSPLFVQPCNRGTGLGVLLPLLVIARSDPEAGVLFIPSDHYVEHEDILAESLRQATAPEVMDSDSLTFSGRTQPPVRLIATRGLGQTRKGTIKHIAEGHRSAIIAAQMGIAIATVEAHRRNILRKFELHSAADLTRYALRHGIIDL